MPASIPKRLGFAAMRASIGVDALPPPPPPPPATNVLELNGVPVLFYGQPVVITEEE